MEAAGGGGGRGGAERLFPAGLAGLAGSLRDFERAVRGLERRGPPGHETGRTGLEESGAQESRAPGASWSSSLHSSHEDLRPGGASSQTSGGSTAKLGDTCELEAFIADLDQILKEM